MANVAIIRHFNVFSFFLPDDKSRFHVAFWTLAFSTSPEEHCRVDLARVFRPDVIVLEAQTAPWVALFNLADEDSSPVSAQQATAARKGVDWNSFPVLFRKLELRCSSIDVFAKVRLCLFFSAILL